jgi:hypothetical protein
MHVIIFHKGYATLKLPVSGQVVYLLEEILGLEISRMRFAGEYYLDWSPLVIDDFL